MNGGLVIDNCYWYFLIFRLIPIIAVPIPPIKNDVFIIKSFKYSRLPSIKKKQNVGIIDIATTINNNFPSVVLKSVFIIIASIVNTTNEVAIVGMNKNLSGCEIK